MGLYRGFGLSVLTFVPSRYALLQFQGVWVPCCECLHIMCYVGLDLAALDVVILGFDLRASVYCKPWGKPDF